MTTETTQHRPVLIIVAGPNGSGKTTITSKILRHEWLENAVYINPDNVAQEKFGNWNSPEAVLKAAQSNKDISFVFSLSLQTIHLSMLQE